MWSSRLFWKLLATYSLLNLTLAAVFLLVLTLWQRTQVIDQVERQLQDTAVVLSSHIRADLDSLAELPPGGQQGETVRRRLQTLVQRLASQTQMRMTLVDPKGTVLADSDGDPQEMKNHRNRPEFIDARQTGVGKSIRRSPTLGVEMLYVAVPVDPEADHPAFARVAMQLATIQRHAASLGWFPWLAALTLGLISCGLASALVGRFIQPLNRLTRNAQAITSGQEDHLAILEGNDEVGVLSAALKQMHEELDGRIQQAQQARDRLATLTASMEEGIIAVDQEEKIIMANQASGDMLGFDADDAEGRPLLEAIRLHALNEAVQKTLSVSHSFRSEIEPSGHSHRFLSLRATRLPGNPCPGIVVVLHDVSELRRLENLRSELVANVSHEVKTPLAAIKAYAETLRLGAINDKENSLEFVKRIEEQSERLHQLFLDMLHIARVESGQQAFDIKEVSVADVVEGCAAQYASEAELKNIRLDVVQPDRPLNVLADQDGLRTIVENLIDNAIKYSPADGCVDIRWWVEDALCVLQIRDTGIGIDPRHQGRVFERFYRVDTARSRELGGTGLGLSIVKHLAQAFGGSVSLQSEVGQGCTFQVRLPLG